MNAKFKKSLLIATCVVGLAAQADMQTDVEQDVKTEKKGFFGRKKTEKAKAAASQAKEKKESTSWLGKKKTTTADAKMTNDKYWDKKILKLVNEEKKRTGKSTVGVGEFNEDVQVLDQIINQMQRVKGNWSKIGTDVELAEYGEDSE